jgi:hypothetical protein
MEFSSIYVSISSIWFDAQENELRQPRLFLEKKKAQHRLVLGLVTGVKGADDPLQNAA